MSEFDPQRMIIVDVNVCDVLVSAATRADGPILSRFVCQHRCSWKWRRYLTIMVLHLTMFYFVIGMYVVTGGDSAWRACEEHI